AIRATSATRRQIPTNGPVHRLMSRARASNLRVNYYGTPSRLMSVEVNHGSRAGTTDFSRTERQVNHRNTEDRGKSALYDERCAQGLKSREVDRTAAPADPNRRTCRDRVSGQNPFDRRLRQASRRPEFPSGIRPKVGDLVTEGPLPASMQPRGGSLYRIENLHFRRFRRTEPLPAFQMFRLRQRIRSVGAYCTHFASARGSIGHRPRRQDSSAW